LNNIPQILKRYGDVMPTSPFHVKGMGIAAYIYASYIRKIIYIYIYMYIYRDGHPSVLSKGVGMATYPTSLKRDGDGHLSILSKEEW
jgi:hypothetical protein